jgi:hypothetical protein
MVSGAVAAGLVGLLFWPQLGGLGLLLKVLASAGMLCLATAMLFPMVNALGRTMSSPGNHRQ